MTGFECYIFLYMWVRNETTQEVSLQVMSCSSRLEDSCRSCAEECEQTSPHCTGIQPSQLTVKYKHSLLKYAT